MDSREKDCRKNQGAIIQASRKKLQLAGIGACRY
jgi:hypothetical protein